MAKQILHLGNIDTEIQLPGQDPYAQVLRPNKKRGGYAIS